MNANQLQSEISRNVNMALQAGVHPSSVIAMLEVVKVDLCNQLLQKSRDQAIIPVEGFKFKANGQ